MIGSNWKKVKDPDGWKVLAKWEETKIGEKTGNTVIIEKEQVTELGLPDEYMYQVKYNGADIGSLQRVLQKAEGIAQRVMARGPTHAINSITEDLI